MEWLKLMSAPLIGALIGYCTNYIAVKMLFRPLKPVKIGKFTLPFTPGIIPKRKPALAKAIGNMVGKSLVGEEEIRKILGSEKMKEAVVSSISTSTLNSMEKSIKDIILLYMEDEVYEDKKGTVVEYVSERIVEGVQSIDIAGIIVTEGSAAVKNLGGMIAMFVNESMIDSFAEPIGNKVQEYIGTRGKELIVTKVEDEVSSLEDRALNELISIDNKEVILTLISEIYDKMVDKKISNVVNAFDICGIVEKKIYYMDVRELEQLIMSVMKNELSTIVNLGALIGFILGLFNLVI